MMRVAMYYSNKDVRLEEVPVPEVGPGELLVKVRASGVCGSDVMEWYRVPKAPLVLGHEIAGEIAGVGEGVEKYSVGDRVFVSHHVPCNTCWYCLNGKQTACETLHTTNFYPGGFSEYVRIPALNVDRGVFLLPPNVSDDAATLIEPLACVVRGQRLAGMKPGSTVLVLGSGVAGLLHVIYARATGAGKIIATDIHPYRLEAATAFGADEVIDGRDDVAARARSASVGRGADLVVVCTSAAIAFEQALQSVGRGGTILFFAPTDPGVSLSVPVNEFWRQGITLMPSYGAAPYDLQVAIELLACGRVLLEDMITHRLPLAEAARGFLLVESAEHSLKVVIKPCG